nr:Arf1e [Gefionella okellyi]
MGLFISRALQGLFTQAEESKILMVGLDCAGKTTILYSMKLGDVVTTVPTLGFNVESVQHRNVTFNVWDMGGQEKLRHLWRHYYDGVKGIIFVVDSNDTARIDEARDTLHSMLGAEELGDAALLVLCNKQDLPQALKPSQVADKLGLSSVKRQWHVQATTATTGTGLYEGLEWLSGRMSEKR